MYLFVYSGWVWVSRHRPRSSRFCSEVLHRWGQLGSYRKQHPHILYQGCASGEKHSPHTVHQELRPSINSTRVLTVWCSFRPSSTLRSGIRRLTWRIRIWFGTSGVCVLNLCTRYSSRRHPLLHFHVPVEPRSWRFMCMCRCLFCSAIGEFLTATVIWTDTDRTPSNWSTLRDSRSTASSTTRYLLFVCVFTKSAAQSDKVTANQNRFEV